MLEVASIKRWKGQFHSDSTSHMDSVERTLWNKSIQKRIQSPNKTKEESFEIVRTIDKAIQEKKTKSKNMPSIQAFTVKVPKTHPF
jgi:hypothetical protein